MSQPLECDCRNSLVEQNVFLKTPLRTKPLPVFAKVKGLMPRPFWDGHASAIDCYWKCWELAFRNIKPATPKNRFIRNYIDTAFNGNVFMWDSVFILMFGRYGRRAFNFQHTLDNFYAHQHVDGFISREIEPDGQDRFRRHDPSSTGPNVMPWSEWEYFLNFGDLDRLRSVYPVLLAYHQWTRRYRTWQDGSYWSSGWGCGMDNQPRVPAGYLPHWEHGHMSWIDSTAQAVLSARMLLNMAKALKEKLGVAELSAEVRDLTKMLNTRMWNSRLAFYCDKFRDGRVSSVKTIGAFWTLLAGVVPPARQKAFLAHLQNQREFNRPHRVPSLSADDPGYDREFGNYWRGGVWPSTNYMVIRGLTSQGQDDLAYEIAANHVDNVTGVFEKTGTVWEDYAAEQVAPGKPAKPDLVGWGGVGPIAVFFEYLIGLRPQANRRRLIWDIRLKEAHGIEAYPFGEKGLLDLRCEARKSTREKPQVTIKSNIPLTVELRWSGGKKTIKV